MVFKFGGPVVDAPPVVGADGTVYVGCWDSKLYAVTPEGNEEWAFQTGGRISSSPAIAADGTVYATGPAPACPASRT